MTKVFGKVRMGDCKSCDTSVVYDASYAPEARVMDDALGRPALAADQKDFLVCRDCLPLMQARNVRCHSVVSQGRFLDRREREEAEAFAREVHAANLLRERAAKADAFVEKLLGGRKPAADKPVLRVVDPKHTPATPRGKARKAQAS